MKDARRSLSRTGSESVQLNDCGTRLLIRHVLRSGQPAAGLCFHLCCTLVYVIFWWQFQLAQGGKEGSADLGGLEVPKDPVVCLSSL